jgi:hypothetical protein
MGNSTFSSTIRFSLPVLISIASSKLVPSNVPLYPYGFA